MGATRTYSGGCFGKHPVSADYLQHHAGGPTIRAFASWCEEGVQILVQRLGRETEARLDAMPTLRFLYPDPASNAFLVGALGPGRDSTGRRFPFSVFLRGAPLKGLEIVSAASGFSSALDAAARTASSPWPDASALFAAVDALPDLAVGDPGAREPGPLGAAPLDPEEAAAVAEDLAVLRARHPGGPPYALRFPLPAGVPAGFWLEVLAAAAPGWLPAAIAWSETGDGGTNAAGGHSERRRLDWMPVPPQGLSCAHLLDPALESDGLFVLGERPGEHGAARVRNPGAALDSGPTASGLAAPVPAVTDLATLARRLVERITGG